MPVRRSLKTVKFAYIADKPSDLRVKVYRAEKPQNYGPERLLKTFALKLQATGDKVEWYPLDLSDLELHDEFLFFEFDGTGSETLQLAAGRERFPGVCAIQQKPNHLPNVMDYETLQPLSHEWIRLGVPFRLRKYSTASQPNENWTFCFQTEPEISVYGPENVNNGFLRPYRQPNIWVAEGVKEEWLEADLKEEYTLHQLCITFDTNLNFRVRNVKPYDFNTISECIKDYEVWIRQGENWQKFKTVTGNYQRVNRIDMNGIKANRIRIRFLATNGCESASVYNVSIY